MLHKSYKGLYCSICNYDYHKYFNLETKEIIYSEKFCRDIVVKSLTTLKFFHIHLQSFLNLISTFLMRCDYKGLYEENKFIPKNVYFGEDEIL